MALAGIYDGGRRSAPGVGLQIPRDRAVRFNAHGSEGPLDDKTHEQRARLNGARRRALSDLVQLPHEEFMV